MSESIIEYLIRLPQPYRDLALVLCELALLALAFLVARLLLRPKRYHSEAGLTDTRAAWRSRLYGGIALLLLLAFILVGAAVLAFNALLLFEGEEIFGGTVARLNAIPPDLGYLIVSTAAKILGALIGSALVVWILRRALSRLQVSARGWDRITANDEAVDAFFSLLKTVGGTAAWLVALSLIAGWLPLPESVPAFLGLTLRVYLIAALGLLIVRAIATVVDTLDGLSARFATPDSKFRYYHDLRSLVPLLRRCLELAIWLGVASAILVQIEAVAAFAVYGPRLIQAVAVFFLGRVAAEAVSIVIDRTQGSVEGLTQTEQQQRATLVPLLKSFARSGVYFVALAVALSVLDLNPLPLLAGAGVLGVVVGFGAQPVITDVVSGFFILFENQFLVGDYVEIGSARGVVESIQLRTTRIRDPNGQQHIIRNGQMAGVVNYSKAYTFAVVEVEVRYDADLKRVYDVLSATGANIAGRYPNVLEPTAIAGIEKFTSAGLIIRTITKVRPGTHGQVARDLREAILTAFGQEGLKMPLATTG